MQFYQDLSGHLGGTGIRAPNTVTLIAFALNNFGVGAVGNRVASLEGVTGLAGCSALETLDLSKNRISDPAAAQLVFSLPLRLLNFEGNPVVGVIRQAHLPNLLVFLN